jgi:hypothetical protein
VADIAVFIVWDEVVRGRELRAIKVYLEFRSYAAAAAQASS